MSIESVSNKKQPIIKGAAIGAGITGVIGAGASALQTIGAKAVTTLSKDEFSSTVVNSFKKTSISTGRTFDERTMADAMQFGDKLFDIFKNMADHPIKSALKTTGKFAAVGLAIGAAIGGVVTLVKKIKQNKAEKQQ